MPSRTEQMKLLSFLIIGSTLVYASNLLLEPKSGSYWLAPLAGIGASLLSCWYIGKVWDPITRLRRSQVAPNKLDRRWLPVVAIGSVLLTRICNAVVNPDWLSWIAGFGMTFMIVNFSYMLIQLWRYRMYD